jgi:trehalose/maltose hydrolase-like predicted phosphorylase
VATPRAANRRTELPAGLDRRFEAVVLWSSAPSAARAGESLEALAGTGTRVAVIAPLPDGAYEFIFVGESGPLRAGARSESADDAAIGVLESLWKRGIDSRDVAFAIDGLDVAPALFAGHVRELADVTAILVNSDHATPPSGVFTLSGGSARLRSFVADQLRRRRQRALPAVTQRNGWSLIVDGFHAGHERVHEALLTLANGHIGTSGASLAPNPSQHPWVVVAGVYDGDGPDTHLLTAPRTFELGELAGGRPRRRVLDLHSGVLYETTRKEGQTLDSIRFVTLADDTTSAMRVRCPKGQRAGSPLMAPADDVVHDEGRSEKATWMRVAASTGGIAAAADQSRSRGGTLDRLAVYRSDAESLPEPADALAALERAVTCGFDRLLSDHRRAWAERWDAADVVVEGDDDMQLAIRLAMFHLMTSVAASGEAAVGARGLTGTGYRGHVFWDADVFVLPFLAATHPPAARAMLEYRVRRLPAAMDAARALSRAGARFPWESAGTGRDVTPTSARDRQGRIVPIRTGGLEEHIVADVAWGACCYLDWSGDEEFAEGPGRRILVETARYWASRIRTDRDKKAHIYGVIGPDEYHESVDDNAYTNVMARWNLRRAAELDAGEVGDDERARWLELAGALVDGYDPTTGIYEQFAGFAKLETLIIQEIAPRIPIAADALLGAKRVSGAQVIKQADVLMLHHLVPDEVAPGSLEPNLAFYGPRTAHGSSLSPAIHASLLARANELDKVLPALRIAARMDLDDLTGSSAAGLHLATMGGLWQALAYGFAGLRPSSGRLHVDPVLPPEWSCLELRVQFRGSKIRVRAEHSSLCIDSDRNAAVAVGGRPFVAGTGKLEFRRGSSGWEPHK